MRGCLGCAHETHKIVVCGLGGSGKTQMLYKLVLNQDVQTHPTVGFNLESLQHNSKTLEFWDIGGSYQANQLHYYHCTKGIIFVVDSSDNIDARIKLARENLHALLGNPELTELPLLVMANKADICKLTNDEIVEYLNLNSIQNTWHIVSVSAYDRNRVVQAINWLCFNMNQ
ncbi:ADP-ribosylation_factor 1 [Hexamita inflata]|uniref:ADP-ribosylation factor 1 n=1 Tax=Hexamita inflata TaxID=28002 RepID=A0AA86Q343_9EUKA|nr:ADP-ribosylation factor 1 [Hexamita inflata]